MGKRDTFWEIIARTKKINRTLFERFVLTGTIFVNGNFVQCFEPRKKKNAGPVQTEDGVV